MLSVESNLTVDTPRSVAQAEVPLLRQPRATDGAALHALVAVCPPLDPNSRYCNLLQCTHFAATSIVAEADGELLGCVTGYLPPLRPDTLFVWQVAVHPQARGSGLGGRMLRQLLARPACAEVAYLDTTVTADNAASEAMFRRLADRLGARLRRHRWFDCERHFAGVHDSEYLLRIGPFKRPPSEQPL